jgi:hypothetical protein
MVGLGVVVGGFAVRGFAVRGVAVVGAAGVLVAVSSEAGLV